MPTLVIVSGALGGIILVVAAFMICYVCRRNFAHKSSKKQNEPKHLTKPASIQPPKKTSGLDILKKLSSGDSDKMTSGSGSSTSTSADGVSNDSSELNKMADEILRTSSALSEEQVWDRGSDNSYKGFAHLIKQQQTANLGVRQGDYVDGGSGLPRPFEVNIIKLLTTHE